MANKSNGKRKVKEAKAKEEHSTAALANIEALQITFYEIESWIEKTKPMLARMTKELEVASTHFPKRRKESPERSVQIDPTNIEQQLLQIQQQQLSWKQNILSNDKDSETALDMTDPTMQWRLSFQPGNLLRLDTNITSVEQLIKAVQKIKLLQEQDVDCPSESTVVPETEDDKELELLYCSSPKSTDLPKDATSVEYWRYAVARRPKINLENYKHCRMNLTGLTKNISPNALNYIGQVYFDCLHPKCSSEWKTFWDRSGDPKRNQVCIDSGLAMMFLHVMRHDKHICENSQSIAGFYFDRARDELMEFFDEEPDLATVEALLNLCLFCNTCKEYSQARIYMGLCFQMATHCGFHNRKNLPTDDSMLRKKILKLLLIMYNTDYVLAVHSGEPPLINDEDIDIDFYEMIQLNEELCELNKTKDLQDRVDFDNNKTIVKETYYIHSVELVRITKKIDLMLQRGATVKQLLAEEKDLKEWYNRLPDNLNNLDYDFENLAEVSKSRDICTSMDAYALQAQASALLKVQYECAFVILHKAILSSIRSSSASSVTFSGQEERSNTICSTSADSIVKTLEIITRCFGWCVCQQFVSCLYHASTVYCGFALNKEDSELQDRGRIMIHRIIRILEAGTAIYEGFPDDLTACLCEFMKKHGIHNSLECSCDRTDNCSTTISMDIINSFLEEDINMFTNFHEEFPHPDLP